MLTKRLHWGPLLLLFLMFPSLLLAGLMMRSGAGADPALWETERTLEPAIITSRHHRGPGPASPDAPDRVLASRNVSGSPLYARGPARPVRSARGDTGSADRPGPFPARSDAVSQSVVPRPSPPAADPFDEVLFELRLADVALSRTILVLLDEAGRPLLPLVATLQYLEIPHRRGTDELQLDWPPPTWRGRVDLQRRTLQLAGAAHTVPSAEWENRPEELYLGVEAMQRVLGADVHVDWENLRIIIAPRLDFPVAVRIANETRRGLLLGRANRFTDRDDPAVGYSLRSGGFAAGWQFAVGGSGGDVQTTTRATLGAAVLGGSLRVGSGVTTVGGSSSLAPAFVQYSRAFGRDAPIRQLRLGEVFSEALVGRSMAGITFSNDPFHTPDYFGQVMIEPVVPAGWEYEVYQGDQLLGVSTRGEQAPIPTHLGYGTNPLRIRMIGPAGQERVQELVYLIPSMQVPGGEWRYRGGAGLCRDTSCSLLSYGDVRRGLTDRTTAGFGLEVATGADSSGWAHPYALISHSPRPDLRVEVRGQWESLLHASLQRYGTFGGWQASAGWSGGERFGGRRTPHWYADGVAALTLPGVRQPLIAGTRLRGVESSGLEAWTGSLSTIVRDYHLRGSYEHGFQLEDVLGIQVSRRIPGLRHQLLRDLMLNTEADFTTTGMRHLNVGITTRPVDHSNLTTSLRWSSGSRVPQIAVSLVTRTPAAYLQTMANRGHAGGSWFASASGGVAYDQRVGAITSPVDPMGQTGIAGRVFIDLDGDGVMGGEETPLADVPVSIGGARVMTDENGSYRYWGVLPHAVVRVGVDTLAFARPDLSPGRAAESVRAVPNVFTRVDIPVVHTRELLGSVTWVGGQRLAVGGLTVEAVRQQTGEVTRALTFSDGEFYISRLVPGDYQLRVAESSLEALGAEQPEGELIVRVEARVEGSPVEAPPIMIARPEVGWGATQR
jgi:hypothetical protein